MQHFLLDSNIIIYLFNGNRKIIDFAEKFQDVILSISIITWIEVLAGSHNHQKTMPELTRDLNRFYNIPLSNTIGLMAASLLQRNTFQNRKQHFQDMLIAATALTHHMPLVTNNPKDFTHIKGLKIISPK